jgi:hypothetical protein
MIINKRLLTVVAVLATLLSTPIQGLACACCADENEYRINFQRATAYERDIMRDIKFGPKATRHEPQPASGDEVQYSATGGFIGNAWNLNLRNGNQSGSVTLTLPLKMLSYVVDTHDGLKSPGGGPRLYKEWRFEGRANVTGFLRSSSPTGYFLVLQGSGNRCDNAADFSHWRLELKSPRVRYTLTGELAQPTATIWEQSFRPSSNLL